MFHFSRNPKGSEGAGPSRGLPGRNVWCFFSFRLGDFIGLNICSNLWNFRSTAQTQNVEFVLVLRKERLGQDFRMEEVSKASNNEWPRKDANGSGFCCVYKSIPD